MGIGSFELNSHFIAEIS